MLIDVFFWILLSLFFFGVVSDMKVGQVGWMVALEELMVEMYVIVVHLFGVYFYYDINMCAPLIVRV